MSFQNETILTLHKKLVNKEVTAVELLDEALAYIQGEAAKFNSFVTLNEEAARKQAELVDAEGVQEGEYLKGIPMAIKDNIVTKDVRTTASSKMLENYESPFDATVVENLIAAGAVIVGKSNLDEFAMGVSTETSYFGASVNPWNSEVSVGGSSGGSAAAVSSGEVLYALGTDTGGSIRQPASFTNLVGVKPTYGLVSRFGAISSVSSLDTVGPMTKTVEEAAIVLQTLASYDQRDMTSLNVKKQNYLENINAGIQGLKVGIVKELVGHKGIASEMEEIMENAVKILQDAGAEVKEISLPHINYSTDTYAILNRGEGVSSLQRYDGIRYGYRTENYNNLEELYVKTRTEGFGDEAKRRIVLGTYITSGDKAHYTAAAKVRTLIKDDFSKAFEDVDVILTPMTGTHAFKLSKGADASEIDDILATGINLAGIPAIAVPGGFINDLPAGIQFIGQALGEEKIFQTAKVYENATKYYETTAEMNGGQ